VIGAAALLALGLAPNMPGASAQTQTVQGAHEFLRITFANGGVSGALDAGLGYNTVLEQWNRCPQRMMTPGTSLMRPTYGEVCEGMRSGRFSAPDFAAIKYNVSAGSRGKLSANSPSYPVSFKNEVTYFYRDYLNPLNREIDWSKVSQVSRNGLSIFVREGAIGCRFTLSSEDLLNRTAFAMEFLKSRCDAAASTGF